MRVVTRRNGTPDEHAEIARQFGLPDARAPEYAADADLLHIAEIWQAGGITIAWVIGDSTARVVEMGHIAGPPLHYADGRPVKRMRYGDRTWPLGASAVRGRRAVLLVRGAADLLAAFHTGLERGYFGSAEALHHNTDGTEVLILFSVLGPFFGWFLNRAVVPKQKAASALQMGRRWFGWSLVALLATPWGRVARQDGATGVFLVIAVGVLIIGGTAFGLGCGYYYFRGRKKSPTSLDGELRKLDALRKDGILSEEEFATLKKKLLA
jgi:hypothetical protein